MFSSAIQVCFSLLVLILSTAFSSPAESGNSSKGSAPPTNSKCQNLIYNTFSAGPNKEVKELLQEMKLQLSDLQKKIEALTGNKTTGKGD